jgi:hypothetical protein
VKGSALFRAQLGCSWDGRRPSCLISLPVGLPLRGRSSSCRSEGFPGGRSPAALVPPVHRAAGEIVSCGDVQALAKWVARRRAMSVDGIHSRLSAVRSGRRRLMPALGIRDDAAQLRPRCDSAAALRSRRSDWAPSMMCTGPSDHAVIDAVEAMVMRFGSPDEDHILEVDVHDSTLATRTMTYRASGVRVVFARGPTIFPWRWQWTLVEFVDFGSGAGLSREEALRRMEVFRGRESESAHSGRVTD